MAWLVIASSIWRCTGSPGSGVNCLVIPVEPDQLGMSAEPRSAGAQRSAYKQAHLLSCPEGFPSRFWGRRWPCFPSVATAGSGAAVSPERCPCPYGAEGVAGLPGRVAGKVGLPKGEDRQAHPFVLFGRGQRVSHRFPIPAVPFCCHLEEPGRACRRLPRAPEAVARARRRWRVLVTRLRSDFGRMKAMAVLSTVTGCEALRRRSFDIIRQIRRNARRGKGAPRWLCRSGGASAETRSRGSPRPPPKPSSAPLDR